MYYSISYLCSFQLAHKEMVFGFLETSAKTGQNVFNAFRKLAYDVTEICDPSVVGNLIF